MPSMKLVAHRARRLGRDVAGSDAGAAGGDHQLHLLAKLDQRGLDRRLIVGHNVMP